MKLIIAEKPSVALGIAEVVGAAQKTITHFIGNGYMVSWCFGHLVSLYMPNDYGNNWAEEWSFSQLPMIPEKWKLKVKEDVKSQFFALKKLMSDNSVTEIICATDADREGECIFRYVYILAGCRKPVNRLWVSSLEESAITSGLRSMKPMSAYDSLFSAGFSRAKADWLVGMNGSRLFSCRYNQKLTLGRVQTPTLAMIVQRDYEVATFVKQKYFTVDLNCGSFTASTDRIDDENAARQLVEKCNGRNAKIAHLKKEIKTVNPPTLYDLTTLQREASRQFGYTAKQTLAALQKLYDDKLATYPRTDSKYLSDDMEETALAVCGIVFNTFRQFGTPSTAPNVKRCINNKKVSGHHAILPTAKIAKADLSKLSEPEKNILMLISAKLILATSEPHKYEAIKVDVLSDADSTVFHATGRNPIEMGWKRLEINVKKALQNDKTDKEEESQEQTLPILSEGQIFNNASAKASEHWTTPPKPYTEDTLLSAMEHAGNEDYTEDMEKKGIGTPATRAAIIESLMLNGYTTRKGKKIVATEKGKTLISVVPDEVKSPKLTAEWEMQLHLIEKGQQNPQSFMNDIHSFVVNICNRYGATVDETTFAHTEVSYKCPKCSNEVKKGKYGLYCTRKCGMNLCKVFGKELTDAQLDKLLSGKQISYTTNGKKTIVLPEVVQNDFNGKTYFQWKTKKGD